MIYSGPSEYAIQVHTDYGAPQMKQTDPQVKLRLPPELKRKIEVAAAVGKRPLSSEIIARLERTFDTGKGGGLSFIKTALELSKSAAGDQAKELTHQFEQLAKKVEEHDARLKGVPFPELVVAGLVVEIKALKARVNLIERTEKSP